MLQDIGVFRKIFNPDAESVTIPHWIGDVCVIGIYIIGTCFVLRISDLNRSASRLASFQGAA